MRLASYVSKTTLITTFILLSITACGGGASSSTPSLPSNTSPTAINDSIDANIATAINIDVLANDSDSDGNSLTISTVSTSNGGIVTIENGVIKYTSANTFLGTETITYSIDDGNGGTASAIVSVNVSVSLTLVGLVTDGPIPFARVTAVVGNEIVETQADENGNYDIAISSSNWDNFVTLNGIGQSELQHVKLISQIGDVKSIFDIRGDDFTVDSNELHRLNITNITTATYGLTTRSNNKIAATSQTELDALESSLDGQAVIELSAAIKNIVDNPNSTLPDGIQTTLDLALNQEQAQAVIENLAPETLQTLYLAMANDPQLSIPVSTETIPTKLFMSFTNQQFSVYGHQPDAGWELQFNDDNTGALYTSKKAPLNKVLFSWSINSNGHQVIHFDEPLPFSYIDFNTYISGQHGLMAGIQRLSNITLKKIISSSFSATYIVEALYSANYDDSQYNRSNDVLRLTSTAHYEDTHLLFTKAELTDENATFALPLLSNQESDNILSDTVTFNQDNTLNSSLVNSATWDVFEGRLIISLLDGTTITYQKMVAINNFVNKVQMTRHYNGDTTLSHADIMINKQQDIAMTVNDVTENYWHFIDEKMDIATNLRNLGIFDGHYDAHYISDGRDEQGYPLRTYYTMFYSSYLNYDRQRGLNSKDGAFAFWFYSDGKGIEGFPENDKGSFNTNEENLHYYNEWQLNDSGTTLVMNEGFYFPLEAYQTYYITPLAKVGDELYVEIKIISSDNILQSKDVTFFTLIPRPISENIVTPSVIKPNINPIKQAKLTKIKAQ